MRGLLVVVLVACGDRERPPTPTHDERAAFRRAPVAPDPTNRFATSPPATRLGGKLFFDPALSGPLLIDSEHGTIGERGKVSCHTCHDGPAMDDRRAEPANLSVGTGRGSRNSPPLVNAAHYTWSNWGGRFESQWALSLAVIEKPEVMNGSRVDLARRIVESYPEDYATAFGERVPARLDPARFPAGARPKEAAWERMTVEDRMLVDRISTHAAQAIAAYLRTLEGRDAPFDRFVAGQDDAIGEAAKRGFTLFVTHCKVCHAGPQLTDNKFHALAVAQFGPGVPPKDGGAFDDRRDPTYGAFRTPTLRNVALTAPYMHDGLFKTLANVVAFYNAGGGDVEGVRKDPEVKRLGLSDRDQADLVEFMQSLTDASLPEQLPPR